MLEAWPVHFYLGSNQKDELQVRHICLKRNEESKRKVLHKKIPRKRVDGSN